MSHGKNTRSDVTTCIVACDTTDKIIHEGDQGKRLNIPPKVWNLFNQVTMIKLQERKKKNKKNPKNDKHNSKAVNYHIYGQRLFVCSGVPEHPALSNCTERI